MTEPRRNMTAAELLDVIEVERTALNPGDIVVLKYPDMLSMAEFDELKTRMEASFKDLGVKIALLEGGLDISVLKAETSGGAA